jgi:leader peptidase (prepilin peptidase)/N-methyltransferase
MAGALSLQAAMTAVAAIPAGWLGATIARRETEGPQPSTPAMVIATLAAFTGAVLVMPSPVLLAVTLGLGWALLVLGAVDLLVLRLPNLLTYPLIAAGLLLSFWLPDHDPIAHLIGAAGGFAVLYAVGFAYRAARGREGLGLGDAKLAAAAGAWLGWQALPSMVLIACAAAFIWIGVAVAARGKSALREEIAFGVPLCFAFWLVWLYGTPDFARLF